MQLPTFSVQSFKAFRNKTHFKLRPLTLLYGRNQAGKSSLLRLLPLIGDSIKEGIPALDLRSPSLMGATFKELRWLGPEPAGGLALAIEAQGYTYRVVFDSDSSPLVNRLQIAKEGRSGFDFLVSFGGEPRPLTNEFSAKYHGDSFADRLTFHSFLVSDENLPQECKEAMESIRESLRPLQRLRWLRADRIPGLAGLAELLGNRDGIIKSASGWLSQQEVVGEALELQSDSSGKRLFQLRRPNHEARPEHLAGEGVRSMLPILLTACWAEEGAGDSPSMLAIEELESHLHPNLQIQLLRRLLRTVNQGIPVVLETHSVYILRAMQLAILDGEIDRADVQLNWIHEGDDGVAALDEIEIGEDAALHNWQPKIFEEEQELSREWSGRMPGLSGMAAGQR